MVAKLGQNGAELQVQLALVSELLKFKAQEAIASVGWLGLWRL